VSYQLLALDLDGTIFGNDLVIRPAITRAIAAAQARGIHVTLATGRMFGATLPFAGRLGIRDPLICYQGGLIRDPLSGETYEHKGMEGALAAEAVEMLLDADIFVIAYVDERLCVASRRRELETYLRLHPEGAEVIVAADAQALVEQARQQLPGPAASRMTSDLAALVAATPPTKLLFVAEPAVVEQQLPRLGAHFDGRLAVMRSHAIFGELTAPGVNKGAALQTLAARLGIPREQVVAIGDQENDLPMIAWAGLGLAMGNAIAAVREAADAVIPPVEEAGVAWAIERYLLADQRPTTNDQRPTKIEDGRSRMEDR
jgi:Cof subfamily protein (haloacid dehalogenase superfamily)